MSDMTIASQPSAASFTTPPTLRDRATRAVRSEVSAVAMRLFLEQGFDKTTVDQIAAEAGLSRTSFFRYFATKEDVVLGHIEERGQQVLEALVARPAREPAWQALRQSFTLLLEEVAASPERGLSMARMLNDAPLLKARHLGKQLTWQDLLMPEVARRLGVMNQEYDPRPRALIAAALACLNAAVDVWTALNGTVDLQTLLDQAMSALTE
jgi:AcrR family transcriptional regulator